MNLPARGDAGRTTRPATPVSATCETPAASASSARMCRSGSPRDRKRRLLDTPSECSPYSSHHVTRGSISRWHNRQCPIRLEDELPNLFLLGWVHVDCAVLTPDNRGPKHRVFPVIDNGRRWLKRDFVDEHPIGQQPDTSPDEVFKVRRHLPRCPPEQRPGGQVASHQLRSSFCLGHAPPKLRRRNWASMVKPEFTATA